MDKKKGTDLILTLMAEKDKDQRPKYSRKDIVDILIEQGVTQATAYNWFSAAKEEFIWEQAKTDDPIKAMAMDKRKKNLDRIADIADNAHYEGNEELALKASVEFVKAEMLYNKQRSNRYPI
tara:strand:+ start:914 stop:1279 length:366 start_codon:yes stop_codon:yes gene_type:complete